MKNRVFKVTAVIAILIALLTFIYLIKTNRLPKLNKLTKINNPGTTVQLSLNKDVLVKWVDASENTDISVENGAHLTFSPDALVFPGNVQIQAVENVKDLPKGAKFITGVDIQADEKLIREPIQLKFPLPQEMEKENIMGFAYNEDGSDWHLYPIEFNENHVLLELNHFSGYGIIEITSVEFAPKQPSGNLSQLEQLIAEGRQQALVEQAANFNDDYYQKEVQTKIDAFLKEWYLVLVEDYFKPALDDATLLERAVYEYWDWISYVEHYSTGDLFALEITELKRLFNLAMDKGTTEANKRCAQEHDPSQAWVFSKLSRIYHMANLLQGLNTRSDLIDQFAKCLKFTLKISTTFSPTETCGLPTENYTGEIKMAVDLGDMEGILSGEGLVTGKFSMCDLTCEVVGANTNQIVRIAKAMPKDVNSKNPEIDIEIEIPNDAGAGSGLRCTESFGNAGSSSVEFPIGWADTLVYNHKNEVNDDGTRLRLKNWEIVKEEDVYARKSYDISDRLTGVKEKTIFELVHTPN
ncbi:MAG: hypothetical protein JW922_01765 [Paludibacteraceae bacterium]|nr:hypothetical protein [Paludibacteraceae bacterium]